MGTHNSCRSGSSSYSYSVPCDRRRFLSRAGGGCGSLALAGLLADSGLLTRTADATDLVNPLTPKQPHSLPKAKAIIWCFMYGGPSAVDTFDFKPALDRRDGRTFDYKVMTFSKSNGPLMKSPFAFRRYGGSGAWVSEIYPNVAQHIDDIAFIKSCYVDTNVHDQALFQVNTGLTRLGFPSAGSWVTYGLGSDNQNLPGYVVMYDPRGAPVGGPALWSSGFLENSHQGTVFRVGNNPVLNLARPENLSAKAQRSQLDFLRELDQSFQQRHPAAADLSARVSSFELAWRMQMAAPEAIDVGMESQATQSLYGIDRDVSRVYGTQLLMGRRLVERGVRFVQVYSGGINSEWDSHSELEKNHRLRGAETDVPIAGLIADLKQRGLLDSTLVIWSGEFGRMPMSDSGDGRDHNPHGFLMWMAGGGIKGGASFGETDDIGFKAVVNPVSIHDVHATVLHCLGIDHERLTYRHSGREVRLTDVAGEVLRPILA